MSRRLRFAALLFTLLLLLSCTCTAAPAPKAAPPPPATSAKAMLLLEAESGTVLAAHNADERLPMASTTKIMTALVVLEQLPLALTVTVPAEAVGTEGSSIYLYKGEQITVQTLLYALLLSSANDAAATLAIATAGSIADFCALMNAKAAALALNNTHFCNPHGLPDEEHYTSARDLARLSAAALQNEVFAKIVATKRYTAPQNGTGATRLFINHNRLLQQVEGAVGVKTGFTRAAGRCLVSAAHRDKMTLIAVTLNAPDDWKDHAALQEWGFAHFMRYAPPSPTISLPVVGGHVTAVELTPTKQLSLLLPRDGAEITCTAEHPRFLYAGKKQGDEVGRLLYKQNGRVIGCVPLALAESVPLPERPGVWERLKKLFGK